MAPAALISPERKEQIRVAWALGKSYSVIAKEIGGYEYTKDGGRSAVAGIIHRMCLPKRGRSVCKTRKPYRKGERTKQPRFWQRKPAVALPERPPEPEAPTPLRCDLMGLPDHGCHFIVTDDTPFLYCGAVTPTDSQYCQYHALKMLSRELVRKPWSTRTSNRFIRLNDRLDALDLILSKSA